MANEQLVLLCDKCRRESGQGLLVQIRYSNSGGWSPRWEGRLCEHLTVKDAMQYYGMKMAQEVPEA